MTLRTGMQTLIDTVRGYANAGTAEWTLDNTHYWDAEEIQRVLDRHRQDVVFAEMTPVQSYSGGTPLYKEYRTNYGDIESGTAVFKIENASGTVGGWTMDYARGVATFTADQGGSAYYWTGHTYDLYGAAADIWRIKAANVAHMFDFTTDGHSIKRSDKRKEYLAMADYYQGKSVNESIQTVKIIRGDV
jgi:hypothetical protein